jgi:hypothetical protein
MELMTAAAVPQNDRDIVFRYSRARAVTAFIVIALVATGLTVFGHMNHAWLAYYVAAVLIVLLLIFQKLLLARFRPTNWLVRMTDNGLFIKFRSYLNAHFPDQDLTIAFIPFSEIRAATPIKQGRELPDRDHDRRTITTSTRTFVEVEIATETRRLAVVLANEAKLVLGKASHSGKRISTRYQHTPVLLGPAHLLRIEWGVVPGVKKFLELLTRHTEVRPRIATAENFADLDGLSRAEQESRLRDLMQAGDSVAAVALARRLYGYDLTRAKEFVDSLAAQDEPR